MRITSAVETSIHAVSPLSTFGFAGSAAAGFTASAAGLSGAAAGLSCAMATEAKARHTVMAIHANRFFITLSLKRGRIGLAGADANHFFQIEHEDLAVADLAGVRRALDCFDRLLNQLRLDRGLDLHLGQEVHHVLRAAVELGVAFLPPEPLHLGHGNSLHADRRERLAHLVELERLDDRGNEFHGFLKKSSSLTKRWCCLRSICCPCFRRCSTNPCPRRYRRMPPPISSRSGRR